MCICLQVVSRSEGLKAVACGDYDQTCGALHAQSIGHRPGRSPRLHEALGLESAEDMPIVREGELEAPN